MLPELERDARAIFEAGLRAVQADRLLRDLDWQGWLLRDLDAYERVVVIGIGKAAMALSGEMEAQLGTCMQTGLAVVPYGHPRSFPENLRPPRHTEVLEAAHPVPDERSVAAAQRVLREAKRCGREDLLLVLLSGGGSSLCADFSDGISLDHAQRTFQLLLESGADIHAINAVRKHMSRVSGGRLAAETGSDVLTLAVSDVVGNDLSVIASGPTVPDPTTAAEALDVLHRFDIWEAVPAAVRRHLTIIASNAALETPKADSGLFERVRTELLGTNRLALKASAAAAEKRGYAAEILSDDLTGVAREVGRALADTALKAEAKRRCLLWGGETTVSVLGDGKGGRNQELALSAALGLAGKDREVVLLSGGTDGRDGPTPAAGACATPATLERARRAGVHALDFLDRNDSYHFWEEVGGHVITGPTHTNVMDIQLALVGDE